MIYFSTETGSTYQLSKQEMFWQRWKTGPESGFIRDGANGKLLEWPKLEVGHRAIMFVEGATTTPEGKQRVILTSKVIKVWEGK